MRFRYESPNKHCTTPDKIHLMHSITKVTEELHECKCVGCGHVLYLRDSRVEQLTKQTQDETRINRGH